MRYWFLLLAIPSILFSQSNLSFRNLNLGPVKAGSAQGYIYHYHQYGQ